MLLFFDKKELLEFNFINRHIYMIKVPYAYNLVRKPKKVKYKSVMAINNPTEIKEMEKMLREVPG